MRKLNTLIIIALTLGLVGCNSQETTVNDADTSLEYTEDTAETAEETVEETAETFETEEERKEQETIKALKEKYNAEEATVATSTSGQSVTLKLNNEYSFTLSNDLNSNNKVETIAEFKSLPKDNKMYNVKLYEVPVDSKQFLIDNPLRLEDTDNKSTNTFIDLICVDNKEVDIPLKVLDNNGKEHSVKKFEIGLDLTVLGIDELGLCRETPTYYAIENGDNYIALLITEETVVDADKIEEQTEQHENAQLRSASENSVKTEENVIIEDTKTEEEIQLEQSKHQEEVNSVYDGLDDKTKEHIQTIKDEFQKKEIEPEDTHNKRLEDIDKVAYNFISNIMIGKFEQ